MKRGRLLLVALAVAMAMGCGEAEETLECDCAADELCWYTTDFDGELDGSGCLPYPAACSDDASCDCVNANPSSDEGCRSLGMEQNSNACAFDADQDQPVLYCVSTLG